jgi:hypothetical protein
LLQNYSRFSARLMPNPSLKRSANGRPPAAKSLFRAIAFARIAAVIPNIPDPSASPVKGALMALMLPGIHLLTLVSVLDDALADYIDFNDIPWPSNTKRDLFNRIEVVSAVVAGVDKADLHRLREMRNAVAHPGDANTLQSVTWAALTEAIDVLLKAFLALEQISEVPSIVAFYEREPTLYPEKLGPNGERMRHKHRVGAILNDEIFLEYMHEVAYFPPRAP